MFTCIHDPGLALYLAETNFGSETKTVPLEWAAFTGTILLALTALVVAG